MPFLLDTNIVSDLVRDPHGAIANRITAVGEANVRTSIIVAAELKFGAAKKRSPRLTAQLEAVLAGLDVVPFAAPADTIYGDLRAELERRGQPMGAHDLLIASQALALGWVLITANEREFDRVPGLTWDNWLRR